MPNAKESPWWRGKHSNKVRLTFWHLILINLDKFLFDFILFNLPTEFSSTYVSVTID